MKNYFFLFSLIFSVIFLSCDPDEPSDLLKLTVVKDGVSFEANVTNNTLYSEQQATQTGRRLDVRANIDGGTFIVSVSNWDWQNPPVDGILLKIYDTNTESGAGAHSDCMDDAGYTYCDAGLGSYLVGTTFYASEFIDDEGEGAITITKNDPDNKTVSGNFDFIVANLGTGEKITFSGSFENLKYTVL